MPEDALKDEQNFNTAACDSCGLLKHLENHLTIPTGQAK